MNVQTKILLGIASLVGIMLLVGWAAINEPVRMQVFTEQWEGRSIEKGAALYTNNCVTCHGSDGKGLAGVAPALNNPMLFAKENPAKTANTALKALQKQKTDGETALTKYTANVTARAELQAKFDAAAEGSTDKDTFKIQLEALDTQIRNFDPNTQTNIDALAPQIAEAQAKVDVLVAQGWEPGRDVRLVEAGWTGTLYDYVESTLISGRPLSVFYWPRAMPYWSQTSGGPLRDDEIGNLVDYVLNYQESALKLTPGEVQQQFKVPGSGTVAADKQVLGTDFDVLAADVVLTGGDAARGSALYTTLACAGCHAAPGGASYDRAPTAGTYTRVVNVRLKVPENAGKTAEQYIAESIIHPNTYIVPGYNAGLMPQNFGDQLDLADLQALVAYLESQK